MSHDVVYNLTLEIVKSVINYERQTFHILNVPRISHIQLKFYELHLIVLDTLRRFINY